MNAWLIRPKPHSINRIREFLDRDIVAIGWPQLGNLGGQSKGSIKALMAAPPYNYTGPTLANTYASVDVFVNRINVGDLLLVPDGDDIYFAEVTGGYSFCAADADEGYPHQRRVSWLAQTTRSALSMRLRMSLKSQRTAADLSEHAAEIQALATNTPLPRSAAQIEVSYPLRADFCVRFAVPADITKAEAERLSLYLRSLYFA